MIEAKPINADLYDKSPNGGVNQIKGVFKLAEARDKFDFGIATDGLKWVFISKEGNHEEFDIRKDFDEIRKRITGVEKILQKKMEGISKKFYEEYNDILHGVKRISKKDCLVNSILHVETEEDKEEIAQIREQTSGLLRATKRCYTAGRKKIAFHLRILHIKYFRSRSIQKLIR